MTQRAVNVLPLEYPDPVVSVEQDVEIDGRDIITSFAWHPSEENCLVNIISLYFSLKVRKFQNECMKL